MVVKLKRIALQNVKHRPFRPLATDIFADRMYIMLEFFLAFHLVDGKSDDVDQLFMKSFKREQNEHIIIYFRRYFYLSELVEQKFVQISVQGRFVKHVLYERFILQQKVRPFGDSFHFRLVRVIVIVSGYVFNVVV